MASFIEIAIRLFLKVLVPLGIYYAGREQKKKDATQKALEGMRDVKTIHERVDSDPDFRKRVREYFNRKS